jgi:hypothetical protein
MNSKRQYKRWPAKREDLISKVQQHIAPVPDFILKEINIKEEYEPWDFEMLRDKLKQMADAIKRTQEGLGYYAIYGIPITEEQGKD